MKYLVKMRKTIIQEYEVEVEADSVVPAMDKAEKSMDDIEEDFITSNESKWSPFKVTTLKE